MKSIQKKDTCGPKTLANHHINTNTSSNHVQHHQVQSNTTSTLSQMQYHRSIIQWTTVPNRGAQRSNPSVYREEARRLKTIYSHSHHFCRDPALSVFALKCQSVCHARMAALYDLEDPGWGDPWFRHWALLLLAPPEFAPGALVVFLVSCFRFGVIFIIAHKLSSCIVMILSYHLFNPSFYP